MWNLNIFIALAVLIGFGVLIYFLVLYLFQKGSIVLESMMGYPVSPEHPDATIAFWKKTTLSFSFRNRKNQKLKLTKEEWEDKQNVNFPKKNFKSELVFNEEKSEVVINIEAPAGIFEKLKVGHADFKSCSVNLFSLAEKPEFKTDSLIPPSSPPAKKEEIPILQPDVLPSSQTPTSDRPFLEEAKKIKEVLDKMEAEISGIKSSPPDKVSQLIQSMLCILSLIKVKLQEQTDALYVAGQQGDKQMDSFRAELQKLNAEIQRIEVKITGITVAPTAPPPPPPVAPPPPVVVRPMVRRPKKNDGWLIAVSIFVFACAVATFVYIATILV